MARGKIVTRQAVIGERGIALISQRVAEMGYLFHPRRVDHGIDGHIDLVDPTTSELLNLTLLVQSKASTRPFHQETRDGFSFVCDERDLNLWLAGNAPVILVFSHPNDNAAWWIDVKGAFPNAESRKTRAVYVDKRTQSFDPDAAPGLLRLAQPRASGLYLQPPPIEEVLTSNLLEVEELPDKIRIAPAAATDYRAAGALLAAQKQRRGGWMLRDGLIISFADLREPPLHVLCSGDVEEHDTAEWADCDDIDTQHRFMDLLTRTVQDAHPDLRWHKERRHIHFTATRALAPRRVGRRKGSRGRTVFGPHYAKAEPTRVSYYHHAALRLRFRRLAGTWYAQLEPDYCFTSDGYRESKFADSLLSGIKRLDRHPAVAGWTRMWANYLRGESDLFSADGFVKFGDLATVTVPRGIDDKWWGSAPVEVATDDDERGDPKQELEARAELAAVGIDADDLLSLSESDETVQPTVAGSGNASTLTRRIETGRANRDGAPGRGF